MAGILAAAIRMVNEPRRRFVPKPRHGQRIHHDVCRHSRFQRPAHHFAVEQLDDDGQVQSAFVRPQIGDIGSPHLSGASSVKSRASRLGATGRWCFESVVTLKRRLCLALIPLSCISCSTRALPAAKPRSRNSLTMRGLPVGTLEFGVEGPDQRQHLRIGQPATIRLAPAAEADIQNRALLDQGKFLLCINPGVLHSTSFAKYAAAFLGFPSLA